MPAKRLDVLEITGISEKWQPEKIVKIYQNRFLWSRFRHHNEGQKHLNLMISPRENSGLPGQRRGSKGKNKQKKLCVQGHMSKTFLY